jgi:general secretion pathway protein G
MIVRKQAAALARAAFTLMEMLVVVAILVVLAGAAVPIYLNYLDNAKRDRVRADFKVLETAIQKYVMDYGSPPPNLVTLTQPHQDGTKAVLDQTALMDPWQHPYQFDGQLHPTNSRPHLMSQGPPGGPVIDNWQLMTQGK